MNYLYTRPVAPSKESQKKQSPHRRAKENFWYLRSPFVAGTLMIIIVDQVTMNLVEKVGEDGSGTGEHRFLEGEQLTYVGCRAYEGGIRRYFVHAENTYVLHEPAGHTCQWLFADPPAYTGELEDILLTISDGILMRRSRRYR